MCKVLYGSTGQVEYGDRVEKGRERQEGDGHPSSNKFANQKKRKHSAEANWKRVHSED